MTSLLKGLSKREILAFKAGGWASLPIDYVIENYGIPFAKKHFGKKAFYSHISQMPSSRRRTMMQPMIVSQESRKRSGVPLYSLAKRAKYGRPGKKHPGDSELKCHYEEISISTQSVGTLRTQQLYQVTQGAEIGERIGSRIRAHYVDVRGYIRNLSTSLGQTCRILFVQDNKPQLGAHTTNLWQFEGTDNDPVDYATGGDLAQVGKKVNTSRYRVISDRKFKLAPLVTSNDSQTYVNLNYRVNINRHIEYLTDVGLETAVNRINPNIFCFVFFELESSTTGANLLQRDIQLYEYFSG